MIKPISVEETVPYTCEEDRESENPTVWHFKNLSFKEELFIKKLSIKLSKGGREDWLTNAPTFLHVTLDSVDNFDELERDDKGKCVIGNIKPWSEKTLAKIPFHIRDELISFVLKGYQEVTKEELKN